MIHEEYRDLFGDGDDHKESAPRLPPPPAAAVAAAAAAAPAAPRKRGLALIPSPAADTAKKRRTGGEEEKEEARKRLKGVREGFRDIRSAGAPRGARGITSINRALDIQFEREHEAQEESIRADLRDQEDRMPANGRFLPDVLPNGKPRPRDAFDADCELREPLDAEKAAEAMRTYIQQRADREKQYAAAAAKANREYTQNGQNDRMRAAGVGYGWRDNDQPGAGELDEADDLYRRVMDLAITSENKATQDKAIYNRLALSTDPLRDSGHCNGDKRLAAIRKTLDSFGMTRSQNQKTFHDADVQACLPLIYGAEWPLVADRVLRELGIPCVRPEVMIMTPRREGKTMSVAMFIVAMMINCPGIWVAVFSTGKRASSALMLAIKDLLTSLPGGRDRILRQNQEQLFIAPDTVAGGDNTVKNDNKKNASTEAKLLDKNVSRLYCFPASVAGQYPHFFLYTRGTAERECMQHPSSTNEQRSVPQRGREGFSQSYLNWSRSNRNCWSQSCSNRSRNSNWNPTTNHLTSRSGSRRRATQVAW